MTNHLSRRDFLKLAGLVSGSAALPQSLRVMPASQPAAAGKPNVLIVVFDAFSARNMSLYGYSRETTPNIYRLAERATVYHNHFAAGNFTTPGTASLLTGTLPWTHRAIQVSRPVIEAVRSQSIFHAFKDYYRLAYSHNPLVNRLFDQFRDDLENYIPVEQFLLTSDGLIQSLFRNDDDVSGLSWARTIKKPDNGGYSYSLLLADLYLGNQSSRIASTRHSFPLGLPYIRSDNYFILEQAIDFLGVELQRNPQPFLAYFHFIPPHEPYRTRREFYDHFRNDGFQPASKPRDMFGGRNRSSQFLLEMRRQYDEYILYLDSEFARFFKQLEDSGLLRNTWLILTSDHGELFERAIWAHTTPVLYQPVIHVPLVIFEPGRATRMDIRTPTSAVDLLPTLLHVTGSEPAEWTEGKILPPFAASSFDSERNIYAIEARSNRQWAPLTKATLMLVKGRHKLTYFFGYPELGAGKERVELYDLENDLEELRDLQAAEPLLAGEMLDELKAKLAQVNQPFA